jgi:hypothetical protein
MNRILPIAIVVAAVTIATAQSPVPPPTPAGEDSKVTPGRVVANKPIWRVNMPGGTYELIVGAMVSVSSHEYVIEPGTTRVTEVNVDTNGQMCVRFYYIEPAVVTPPGGIGAATFEKVKSMAAEAGERTGTSELWKNVRKSYPTSTHARTIEYRVSSKESLNKIFSSASKCLRSGREDEVKVSD